MVLRMERDGERVEALLRRDTFDAVVIDAAAQPAYWGKPLL